MQLYLSASHMLKERHTYHSTQFQKEFIVTIKQKHNSQLGEYISNTEPLHRNLQGLRNTVLFILHWLHPDLLCALWSLSTDAICLGSP